MIAFSILHFSSVVSLLDNVQVNFFSIEVTHVGAAGGWRQLFDFYVVFSDMFF